jgi:two-component system cell cycle sensor histidine kinase/response regulator CckA
LGACLEGVLQGQGYHTTISESYGRFSNVLQFIVRRRFDLVILTNTSIPPVHIPSIVPEIKARHPQGRIIVLSGYFSESYAEDLKQKGIDEFFPLPFEEDALLGEVARLLSNPAN